MSCGILGIVAGVKKEHWAVLAYFIFSVLTLLVAAVAFVCSVYSVSQEYKRDISSSLVSPIRATPNI